MNTATLPKGRPTPPAPQHKFRRLSFFLLHAKDYSPAKIEAETQRVYGIRRRILPAHHAVGTSELEIISKTAGGKFSKIFHGMKAWMSNTVNRFRPENRKLGQRGS